MLRCANYGVGMDWGSARFRITSTAWVATLVVFAAALGVGTPGPAGAAGDEVESMVASSVTIDDPGTPSAGTVELGGTVGVHPGETTTVLFVMDATNSTTKQTGADCSGNGALGPEDDYNADGSVGDVLDCEIAGVVALNSSLINASGNLATGLVAFGNTAAAADADPAAGVTTLVQPGATAGDSQPLLEKVARSVRLNEIGLYQPTTLGGSGQGTAFSNAIEVALATLQSAPAGPKWIMFMSDGLAAIEDTQLAALTQSKVSLRVFGIGAAATCDVHGSLYKMASATGEACVLVANPGQLAAGLTGAKPDSVNSVNVRIEDVVLAAKLDAIGGWHASFTLGAGKYTATVTAVFASGVTRQAKRTFSVSSVPGGPKPDKVAPGPGALLATHIEATPAPTVGALPSLVDGRVGAPIAPYPALKALRGATVALQWRALPGDNWTAVATDRVDKVGRYQLRWKPGTKTGLLRVELTPPEGYGAAAAAVPSPPISSCVTKIKKTKWSITCATTAAHRKQVVLRKGKEITDRARVRMGFFTLRGTGRIGKHTIELALSKKQDVDLKL